MAQMQVEQNLIHGNVEEVKKRMSKEAKAYDMIKKTGCTLRAASISWKATTKNIIAYANANDLPILWNALSLDDEAKRIVAIGGWTQGLKFGLKQRVAYHLAIKVGVSEACRRLKCNRRGLYYYCVRYNLPTPLRATGLIR